MSLTYASGLKCSFIGNRKRVLDESLDDSRKVSSSRHITSLLVLCPHAVN